MRDQWQVSFSVGRKVDCGSPAVHMNTTAGKRKMNKVTVFKLEQSVHCFLQIHFSRHQSQVSVALHNITILLGELHATECYAQLEANRHWWKRQFVIWIGHKERHFLKVLRRLAWNLHCDRLPFA